MAGWFDEQIRNRKRKDRESFTRTIKRIASAVTGEGRGGLISHGNEGNGGFEDILMLLKVSPDDIPDRLETLEDRLEYALRPSGIMFRDVKLKKGWRKDACGLMLGFFNKDEAPVALIPDRLSGYRFYDPEAKAYRHVTDREEELFMKEAFVFYRPFPLRKLSIQDLVRYIIGILEPSDYIMAVLSTLAVTLIGMLIPRINFYLFDTVAGSGSISLLLSTGVFLISVFLSSAMLSSVKNLITARIDTKLSISVEAATMMRLLSLPASFFKDYSSGELSSRASYVNSLCSSMVSVVLNTGLTSLFSLVYITQIFAFAPGLTLPALSVILVTVLFFLISSLIEMRISKKRMLISSKENGLSYALVSGIQKIKVTGAEMRAFSKWGDMYSGEAELNYNPPLFLKINGVISTAITLIGTIVMYNAAIVTGLTPALYYAFNTAYGMVMGAFMSLFSIALTAARIRPVFEMAEPILRAEPEISENKEILNRISGGVEINHLSFRYDDNSPYVLKDLSLKIKPKQYIAIVGKTGCGKSTFVRLLLGFEKPEKGGIYYDGKDIESVDLRSLRKHIGVVTQNGKLFQGDIFSNIVIASPGLKMEDAWAAAEIAGIDEDIRNMPMGMNTVISEGSGGISGGQKQRLMIARAVAPKPKILILDEATSALDNITQKRVSEALDKMNCTRIVIAHRLSTIRQCDRILVFDDGNIAEDGTYDELIEKNGVFAELVARQRVDI
ncbi:MAG: NHLP bacteriocin export ABC transporter permease/ATPase subunit [Lachnospiraceae bacterium]|nr:NHLP bacteriocin export ABC transporter permease/ATPase subunit [Lachnospiraceae bacterium]